MLWTVVSITHSETHIIQGEKKQISRLSPHPTQLFYFITGQQTAILFFRNAWKIAFLFCLALLPPWTMAQTPRKLQSDQEGTGGIYPVQEAQGLGNTVDRDKAPSPTQMQNLSVFDLQLLGVFYLRTNFPLSFLPIHTAVPEYSKSLFLGICNLL